jgi:hypothetical protein
MAFTSVSDAVLDKPDLLDRELDVLNDIQKHLPFIPANRLGDSRYWTKSYAGAVFYTGTYKGQAAVLKIQGTRPPFSEIDHLKAFAAQNQSLLIRPPRLYAYLYWDDHRRYEALILEAIDGRPVISTPTTASELTTFFSLYRDYRAHCRRKPWLPPPTQSLPDLIDTNFDNWIRIRQSLFPHHPLFTSADELLVEAAMDVLVDAYHLVKPEFLHGHFSYRDLLKQGDEYILFSNLFWKYLTPFYDAVFAYHWFIYHLSSLKNVTPELIESQRQLWLNAIVDLCRTTEERNLMNLALLERAAAGLNLDVLSLNPHDQITGYLFKATRREVTRLIGAIDSTV